MINNQKTKLSKKLFISEIKDSHDRLREFKRLLNRERSKLNVLYKKYCFIDEIVNPKVDDIELELFILDLFKNLGLICKRPRKKADFDLTVEYNSQIVGIEVKNDRHVKENELFQAKKYAGRYQMENNKILHPLVIWNNTKANICFDINRINDALANNYGIMTTTELLKGYLLIKSNKMSFGMFYEKILRTGLIKFSNYKI